MGGEGDVVLAGGKFEAEMGARDHGAGEKGFVAGDGGDEVGGVFDGGEVEVEAERGWF